MAAKFTLLSVLGATGLSLAALAGPAFADGEPGSLKDAPAQAESRQLTVSFTAGATSDYVFRGLSNNAEDPTVQGSIDIGYGIFYAGIWGSGASYAGIADDTTPLATFTAAGKGSGPQEFDFYAGVKPVWGPVTFDFATLYYAFPSQGGVRDADYWEFKAAASVTPITNLTLTVADYYSPDFQYEVGKVNTVEGTAAYTLPQFSIFTPTVSGTFGYQKGYDDDFVYIGSIFGEEDYTYWNAGLALAVEKFTFDFRYWDTNLNDAGNCEGIEEFNCSAKFVFSAKVTLP